MDEFVPTQRDGHVSDAGKAPARVLVLTVVLAEKQQVARLRSAPDRVADPELLVGIAWRIGAEEAHEGLCQARTVKAEGAAPAPQIGLSLIHISEPTRLGMISYAVFCLK